MKRLWEGRTEGKNSKAAESFNSSISFDKRLYLEDIRGSIAHVGMLANRGIISKDDAVKIGDELRRILHDIENGALKIDPEAEDIHSFVEFELTKRIGDTGKKLHTARSRNDQVALDLRLYMLKETAEIYNLINKLELAFIGKAENHKDDIMPGYTHLQRAQPVSFGQHMLAYAEMLERDKARLKDAAKRTGVSPLGSLALAGTGLDIDRHETAKALGMKAVCKNSMDGVSDRDFVIETAGALAILMMHLSRYSEEIILWSSFEFRFIDLDETYSTGSSIMPQKKNPDMAELIRGKCGRVFGSLMGLLTLMKGLPLAYNKDMQEDKELIFDALDTVKASLTVAEGMTETMTVRCENMRRAAQKGFINATDLADYLVSKGLPFREAYRISGRIVSRCEKEDAVLEGLPLKIYKEYCSKIDENVYDAVNLEFCLKRRTSEGGAAPSSVEKQIKELKERLENEKSIY